MITGSPTSLFVQSVPCFFFTFLPPAHTQTLLQMAFHHTDDDCLAVLSDSRPITQQLDSFTKAALTISLLTKHSAVFVHVRTAPTSLFVQRLCSHLQRKLSVILCIYIYTLCCRQSSTENTCQQQTGKKKKPGTVGPQGGVPVLTFLKNTSHI